MVDYDWPPSLGLAVDDAVQKLTYELAQKLLHRKKYWKSRTKTNKETDITG